MSNLKKKFKQDLIPELVSVLALDNLNEAPKLVKITLNMGLGEAVGDKKIIQKALKDLELIAGQKPVVNKAKKSVAGFKIRAGWPIGIKVTLRAEKMYDFLERLINIALPRVVDFRGLSLKSFDGKGNYSMGVKEQIIFPEINYDEIDCLRGMDITFTTTAKTDAHGEALLKAFKFPFREK